MKKIFHSQKDVYDYRQPTRPSNFLNTFNEWPSAQVLVLYSLQVSVILVLPLVFSVIIFKSAGIPLTAVQNHLSLGLVALAIAALVQCLRFGPIGSGYLCPPLSSAIYLQPSLLALAVGGIPTLLAMTIFAGLCECGFAVLIRRARLFIPPEICGLTIFLVGINVGTEGLKQLFNYHVLVGDPHLFDKQFGLMILTLGIIIAFNVWGRGYIKHLAALIGIIVGNGLAVMMLPEPTTAGAALIQSAHWFALPHFHWFGFHFSGDLALPFLIAAFAAALRTVGVVLSSQQINDTRWKKPDYKSIKRGVRSDGIGSIIAGLLGFNGISSSPSATGLAIASHCSSRYLAIGIAGWMLLLACMPRLLDYLVNAPIPIAAAMLLYYGSFMVVGGFRVIGTQVLGIRQGYVLGLAVCLAISSKMLPLFFDHLPTTLMHLSESPLTVGLVSAFLLNLILRIGIKHRQKFSLKVVKEGGGQAVEKAIKDFAKSTAARDDVVHDATEISKEVVRSIMLNHLAKSEIQGIVSYNEVELVICFEYQGTPLVIKPFQAPTPEDMVDEEVFTLGIASYVAGVYPDDVNVTMSGDRCHIKLVFAQY